LLSSVPSPGPAWKKFSIPLSVGPAVSHYGITFGFEMYYILQKETILYDDSKF